MSNVRVRLAALGLAASLPVAGVPTGQAQSPSAMSFFVTSRGPGKGANFGGLLGADKHCQTLAAAAGAGQKTWRAYLSQNGAAGHQDVNARDRIGSGPWTNAKGVVIARTLDELHSDKNNLTKQTALTERGEVVNGRGDTPNRHDILTGSRPDGTAIPGTASANTTCGNWVRYFPGSGSAQVGHHDREGGGDAGSSWNSAHMSKGCSQDELQSTGGDALIYCFAID
ncbi:MAG: lectin [Vicinamibacterales bacterium]